MSTITLEIIEKLKVITLLEASELISKIEETFKVNASAPTGGFASASVVNDTNIAEPVEEKSTFDVILESIAVDKRVGVLKVIRDLTTLGLKESKEFSKLLPKAVKEGVSKTDAEEAKEQLEKAGGIVKIS